MTNLDTAIAALREKMEIEYQTGENGRALETSRKLDCLIAMRQREHFLRERRDPGQGEC